MASGAALQVAQPNINPVGYFQQSQQQAQQRQALALEQKKQGLQGLYMMSAGILRGNLDGQADPAEWEQALDMMAQQGADPATVEAMRGRPELANVMARGSAEALRYSLDERQLDFAMKKFEQELQQAAQGPKPTDDMREYEMAVQQGYEGSFMDYMQALRQSGATSVNVNTADQNGGASVGQFQRDLGGIMAKDYEAIRSDAKSARGALASLSLMEQAVNDPSFYSGIGSDQIMALKRIAAAVGIDPEGVSSMETFNALNKQAALDVMGGSLGTGFSNADRDFVIEQVPNLGNTPDGNRKLIGIQRKLAERKIEIAQMATAYVQEHGVLDANFESELAAWAEANPIFADEMAAPTGGGGRVYEAWEVFN